MTLSLSSFVAMVDIDGDGLISYDEYMLFRTLLSVPTRKVSARLGLPRTKPSSMVHCLMLMQSGRNL